MKKINIICAAIFLAAAAYLGVYMVQDKAAGQRQKPSIEIAEELVEVSVADGEEALLKGVTASDAEDGDLTDKVIVETVSRFTPDQHRVVTYAVVDSDKMVAHAQRELVYTDYAPIRFSMDKPLSFETDDTDLAGAVHARDCLDGDISGSIRMTSEEGIDTENPGMYSAELKVTNSAGDTAVLPVTVEIYDANAADRGQIALSDYIVYIPRGTKIDPASYLKSVRIRGSEYLFTKGEGTYGAEEAGQANTIGYKYVSIENNVNPDVAGNYEIHYAMSGDSKVTGTAVLYVIVTDGGAK